MSELELQMSVDEVNLILDALGQQPFAQVFGLVAKIQEQASAQLGADGSAGGPALPGAPVIDGE